MCSIDLPANDADANLPTTVPIAASGAIDYCALLSLLKHTTARVVGQREREREQGRRWNQKFNASGKGRQYRIAYELRNKKKRSAYKKMRRALKRGELIRPWRCEKCKTIGRVDGHHDDYDKPLEVRWLCRGCHKTWHHKNGDGRNA